MRGGQVATSGSSAMSIDGLPALSSLRDRADLDQQVPSYNQEQLDGGAASKILGDHVRLEKPGKRPSVRNSADSGRRTIRSGIACQCSWRRPTTDLCRPCSCASWRGFRRDFLRASPAKIYSHDDTVDQYAQDGDISTARGFR